MQQLNIPEYERINIDFDDKNLSEAVRTLQPVLYWRDGFIHCHLGPGTMQGISGSGATLLEALDDWEANMRKRIIYPKKNDEVVVFVKDKLNASKKDVG